jgi:hypothetical protein
VLRLSVRLYVTWYRVMVTALFDEGVVGVAVVPISFGTSLSTTTPASLNTVGHGAETEQGSGVVTLVRTSEISGLLGVAVVPDAPRMPSSESITSNTGDRPCVTTLPHEIVLAASAVTPMKRVRLRILVIRVGVFT